MIESYQLFWRNYFNVQGRTRRRHYWYATLANIIVLILLSILTDVLTWIVGGGDMFFKIIYETIDVIILIGTFTMSVRRFHDVGRTMLIPLIMLVSMLLRGLIVLLETISDTYLNQFYADVSLMASTVVVLVISVILLIISIFALIYCIADSEQGTNEYGPNPKA
ncbi:MULTISPECIES: DUF805 domain-containing protein [unclassified Staphylococcus]|uniref:DUF805 domain-containing protein n=1 Tax=unclassified Staphylococcus TaxID=91994 RepID=UPI00187F65A6|nr:MULTISPECIES: DUF805 domain-containing protein [unclassified Staphylococcus]MBF2758539.1 DUF805 domain-containing protein [Staphylococcus haemolyticus]MBF2774870.1 DUF805 domain-containing protein [Staphylococcus haemolyticus]MBF2777438.1 DUF805 domain-containing protein [Staphylococcus haemolyticus]MBF2816847.1 DUF805 domain-containing protein [Staphylococcus haemolyticus]MBF9721697.1 DUF805 domain-containing protein [Staphylococcus haemolyticus]